jgi:hypothetical protein
VAAELPSGLTEELGLAEAAVAEHERQAERFWQARRYAAARVEQAEAEAEREHVARLRAELARAEQ